MYVPTVVHGYIRRYNNVKAKIDAYRLYMGKLFTMENCKW